MEDFLTFTMETGEDFQSGWLASLDTDLKMTNLNQVEYRFYEKPMSSNMTVQKLTAMEENSKMKTLSNDLIRRLLNTSEALGMEERVKIVDDYGQKLLNSGYGIEQTRTIIINGLKGYEKKLKESRSGGRKLHRTSEESSSIRSRKKLIDKSEWFKVRRKVDTNEPTDSSAAGHAPTTKTSRQKVKV